MRTTLNQLKRDFKTIADAHQMVHSFYWGSPDRIAKQETVNYPLVFAYPVTVRLENNITERSIKFGVCDKIFKDWDKNLDEVHSDCELIFRDFYRVMNKNRDFRMRWRFETSPNGEMFILHAPGNNDNADYIAGVVADLTISFRDKSGICDIPMDDILPPPPDFCKPANIRIINSLEELLIEQEAPSGASIIFEAPNGDLTIKYESGVVVDTVSVPSGSENEYTLPSPESGEVVIKNSIDETLDVISVDSGQSVTETIPDSQITLVNSLNEVIEIKSVPAENNSTLIAPDATAIVEYADGTPIVTESIPSGTATTVVIPNINDEIRIYLNNDIIYNTIFESGEIVNININI